MANITQYVTDRNGDLEDTYVGGVRSIKLVFLDSTEPNPRLSTVVRAARRRLSSVERMIDAKGYRSGKIQAELEAEALELKKALESFSKEDEI